MKTSSMVKSGSAGHVLLVDDNRDGLLARKALLQEQGMTITTATNGEDAFDAFTRGKFDLLITDFKMPKMNGIELIRRIRPLQPNLAIILLSGFVDALGLDEKSTGADVVINKGAHEIPHLLRSASRLLSRLPAKKPPASQKAGRKVLKAKGKSV
jgi:two-component system response regulator ChvI